MGINVEHSFHVAGPHDKPALHAQETTPDPRAARRAVDHAAILVAFDALEIEGSPLLDEPLAVRRRIP